MEKQDKSQCDMCLRRRTTCIEGICPKCQVYINCDTRECRCNKPKMIKVTYNSESTGVLAEIQRRFWQKFENKCNDNFEKEALKLIGK